VHVAVAGIVCLLLVASCAIPFRDDTRRRSSGQDDISRTDALGDPGDDLVPTNSDIGLTDYARSAADTIGGGRRAKEAVGRGKDGVGYDVQFFASANIVQARQVKQQADTLTDMPVRIVFSEPYYKVVAGPYWSFEEAEAFLRLITKLDYPSAWIVAHETNRGK